MFIAPIFALLLAPAAVAAGAAPAAPANPPAAAKVRCKLETEIGSLANTRKICHTEAEWQAIYRGGRAATAEMQRPGAPPALNTAIN